MKKLNIAVAGCGPAGFAAALFLERQGHAVTLFDQFKNPKPIGSGLMIQPTGMAVLSVLGLAEQTVKTGAPIKCLLGLNAIGDVALDARYEDLGQEPAFGIGIHRASLFDMLFEAARMASIPIQTGRKIAGSQLHDDGRSLQFSDGTISDEFDLIVDALGVGTSLSQKNENWLKFGALWATLRWPDVSGFSPDVLEQRYRCAKQMVGVLPIGRRAGSSINELAFFWSIRCDEYQAWQDAGLDHWKAMVEDLWPECASLLDQIVTADQLTFARYAHRTLSEPVDDRLVHIGDAWHSASPQLGQGANMALLDAYGLSAALDQAVDLPVALQSYVHLRRSHVRRYQTLTAAFTPLYQSSRASPSLLRDVVLAPLSRIGPAPRIQATLVAGLSAAPLEKLGLSWPDYSALSAAIPSSINPRASGLLQS